MIRYFLFAYILFGLCLVSLQAQNDFIKIEQTALTELKQTNTPGGAIAIIKGDKVVFSKGFGISSVETRTPVTTKMLFRIGSVTKMFTAAALLTLESEGKLKVEDKVGKYVRGLNPQLSQITLHQLLTHTSGLTDKVADYGSQDESALGLEIRKWKDDYVFTEKGKIFSYSNPGYALLGLVIEENGKMSFADQMEKSLFKPLGMKNTTFRPNIARTFPLSQGHQILNNSSPEVVRTFTNNVVFWADGFMLSSLDDLSRFVIALMNEGRIDGKQVIPAQVVQKLMTPYVETISFGKDEKYGYGLQFRNYRGVQVAEHAGAITGFGCFIRIAFKERIAVIGLANQTDVALDRTIAKAFETLLPVQSVTKKKSPEILPMSIEQMNSYTGIYSNNFQSVELIVKAGKLVFKFGDVSLAVNKIVKNEFMTVFPDGKQFLNFFLVSDADGQFRFLHSQGRALKKVS